MIQACVEQNVQRLVYTSSIDVVIGRRCDVISAGDESLPVPRRFLFQGYAESKRRAELLVCEADGRALAKGQCSDDFDNLKPRLHQKHVAGYKYPERETCIRLHVDGYNRRIQVISSVLLVDTRGYIIP